MMCDLANLLRNAAGTIDPKKDRGAYAYMLTEVADHIEGVREGRFTLDQFAEHYRLRDPSMAQP